jgi:quercetin dioxygenase-like cupin family protein
MHALLHAAGDDGWSPARPGLECRVANGAQMTVTQYRFSPGAIFPRHRHTQEQAVYLLKGSIVFRVGETAHELTPGDLLVIAADAEHDAWAGAAGAQLVSVVAPARGAGDIDYA